MKKAQLSIFIAATLLFSLLLNGCSSIFKNNTDRTFSLLVCTENRDMEEMLKDFSEDNDLDITIEYSSTLDAVTKLNEQKCPYDGVWLSNSIWLYMLNGSQRITNAKSISINPVVFAIKKSQAQQLGFIDNDVHMIDIVNAVKSNQLTFLIPSVTQTNSGASAYLGFLNALAGNPEILTSAHLKDETVISNLTELFSGVERVSGNEEYLGELFLNGNYNAMVNYEFEFIALNKTLEEEGKEPLYLIYPVDGVSISDSPFAYVDKGDAEKFAIFDKLQRFLLSEETQKSMAQKGRRTGYGGQNPYGSQTVFNPSWGIDMKAYLSPVNYPSSEVIKSSLLLFQNELKKPSITVFCLDMSGSMSGSGYNELIAAMDYILTPESASKDYVQFTESDIIYIIPFDSKSNDHFYASGDNYEELLKKLHRLRPEGGTDIYDPVIEALKILDTYDNSEYTFSIVLMTDGQSNVYRMDQLTTAFFNSKIDTGVFSITFGEADERELQQIAEITGGKVFDGKTNLLSAFKEIRGYN